MTHILTLPAQVDVPNVLPLTKTPYSTLTSRLERIRTRLHSAEYGPDVTDFTLVNYPTLFSLPIPSLQHLFFEA